MRLLAVIGIVAALTPAKPKYNFDPRIHTLGNVGFMGAVHSAMAPAATWLIDKLAYDGRDIRYEVAHDLVSKHPKDKSLSVCDLGCGVGMSSFAFAKAARDIGFNSENTTVVGIDSSPQMIFHAHVHKMLWNMKHKLKVDFKVDDIENTPIKSGSCDIVLVSYVFHEVPRTHWRILFEEMQRIVKPHGKIVVLDIADSYSPSDAMLAGEPFVIDYLHGFGKYLINYYERPAGGFHNIQSSVVVDGHVRKWVVQM